MQTHHNPDVPSVQSEDCLNLNVYTPIGATPESDLAVMVFFHGVCALLFLLRFGARVVVDTYSMLALVLRCCRVHSWRAAIKARSTFMTARAWRSAAMSWWSPPTTGRLIAQPLLTFISVLRFIHSVLCSVLVFSAV
jgi:hypothetical protein